VELLRILLDPVRDKEKSICLVTAISGILQDKNGRLNIFENGN
jgi:hypothetical protein